MRRFAWSVVIAGVLVAAGILAGGPSHAVTAAPGGLRPAIDAVDTRDDVACWKRGRRGWGRYPCGYFRYYTPAPVIVFPRPAYRHHRYWRRHRR